MAEPFFVHVVLQRWVRRLERRRHCMPHERRVAKGWAQCVLLGRSCGRAFRRACELCTSPGQVRGVHDSNVFAGTGATAARPNDCWHQLQRSPSSSWECKLATVHACSVPTCRSSPTATCSRWAAARNAGGVWWVHHVTVTRNATPCAARPLLCVKGAWQHGTRRVNANVCVVFHVLLLAARAQASQGARPPIGTRSTTAPCSSSLG